MDNTLKFWPDRDIEYLYSFGWVLVAVLIFLLILSYYKRRKLEEQTLWTYLLQDGLKHQINATEQKLLAAFYQSLNRSQRKQVLTDRKSFRNLLYSFLERTRDSLHRDKVEMLDRLFSFVEFKTELHNLEDLQRGEIASIEIGNLHRLAVVARESETPVLYVRGMDKGRVHLPLSSSLFLYRQKRGSYTIPVTINAIGKDSIRIEQAGKPEFKPDHDLVAESYIRVNLQKWPKFDQETEESDTIAVILHGVIRKFSIRAFMIDMETESVARYDRNHDIWQMEMAEPPDLSLRGDLFPAPGSKSRFYFKPHEMTDEEIHTLNDLLSESNPALDHMN